jgi:hypothetical protein
LHARVSGGRERGLDEEGARLLAAARFVDGVREIDLRLQKCGVEREDAPVQGFRFAEAALPEAHLSEEF